MQVHDIKNFLYFQSSQQKKSKDDDSNKNIQNQKILEILANYALKEKPPTLEELESILQNSVNLEEQKEKQLQEGSESLEDSSSFTKLLKEKGYLKNGEKWLTNKGFFAIGNTILQNVLKDLSQDEVGLHETKFSGNGNVVIDSTKNFEPRDDIKFLSVPQTIINSVKRIAKTESKIEFPITIEPEDLEKFETLEDVRVAIVYCIDLSSTMKYLLGKNGRSRIESAKKALWSLYILNKKFFPNDSIFVVGFGSMASVVNPFDIPFLKTYDANDNFLHYTNYQAVFRLARKILKKSSTQNKKIIMITDGQPSACYVDNDNQKNEIILEKPYSNFYFPDEAVISKVKKERNMDLDTHRGSLVYLCYRYKKVDPKINTRTLIEAKKCKRDGIQIDTIVVSDEAELLNYVQEFEKELLGRIYHITDDNMDKVLVHDYLKNTKKILNSNQFL